MLPPLSLSSLGRLEDLEKESRQAGGPPKMPQRPITDQARRIPIRQEGLPRPASLQAHPDQAAKTHLHRASEPNKRKTKFRIWSISFILYLKNRVFPVLSRFKLLPPSHNTSGFRLSPTTTLKIQDSFVFWVALQAKSSIPIRHLLQQQDPKENPFCKWVSRKEDAHI